MYISLTLFTKAQHLSMYTYHPCRPPSSSRIVLGHPGKRPAVGESAKSERCHSPDSKPQGSFASRRKRDATRRKGIKQGARRTTPPSHIPTYSRSKSPSKRRQGLGSYRQRWAFFPSAKTPLEARFWRVSFSCSSPRSAKTSLVARFLPM